MQHEALRQAPRSAHVPPGTLTGLFVYVVVAGYLHMSGYSPGACHVIEADQTFAGACLDFDAWGWLLGRWAA